MDKPTEDKCNAQIFVFKTGVWKEALEEIHSYIDLTDIKLFDYYSAYRITLELLKKNQGWPLSRIESDRQIGSVQLSDEDLAVFRLLASEGFIPPPAIKTAHAGTNYFLFGPRPGKTRLPPYKRQIYEAAMALVAAVRQGQLLPAKYKIHWPKVLLLSLRERGYIRANTEAIQQYKQVAVLKVGRLEKVIGGWARFVLIQLPENIEAVDLAIDLVTEGEPPVTTHDEVLNALRKDYTYVESLIGRKLLIKEEPVKIDEETQNAIETFLLRGR